MFLKLSSNIVGELSPNIAIYCLVGTELMRFMEFQMTGFVLSLRQWDTCLVSSGVSLTSWEEGKVPL